MELNLENKIQNDLETRQNKFLQSTLGKAINNGINIGLRYILPNWAEDKIIELKDNLINYGIKDGISKTIKSAIDVGKSTVGIVTGEFENINQIQEVIKSGGIIDSFSELFNDILSKLRESGKINTTTFNIIKNGKDTVLDNIEKNISNSLNNQNILSSEMDKNIKNWKDYYNKQDFLGMEKEYKKIKVELKKLIPIENTINEAKNIEVIHNLVKNNGRNFNLSQEEIELAKKLTL